MRRRTFEQTTAWLVSQLALACLQSSLLAGHLLSLHLGWLPVADSMRHALTLGLAVQPLLLVVAVLPAWSHRSHLLAVAHGMIPRHSATWARWAWRFPGVNLWLPFTMLRERWRFYRCAGRPPIARAQVLVLLALGAFCVPTSVGSLLLFLLSAISACIELRRAVRTIAAAQQAAELQAHAENIFG
jgi:hypothetical protein